jgi:hypothetical protein
MAYRTCSRGYIARIHSRLPIRLPSAPTQLAAELLLLLGSDIPHICAPFTASNAARTRSGGIIPHHPYGLWFGGSLVILTVWLGC